MIESIIRQCREFPSLVHLIRAIALALGVSWLKQVSGLKEVFSGPEFSDSWTEYEERYGDQEDDDADE